MLFRFSTSTPSACWRRIPTRFSRACTPLSGTYARIPDSLQKLLDLFHKAGENTHVSEVMELLAHASVQSGDLPRARDLYQKLASIEPQTRCTCRTISRWSGSLAALPATS